MKSSQMGSRLKAILVVLSATMFFAAGSLAQSAKKSDAPNHPWMNKSLSADDRADMVIKEMTLDEKIQLVHGTGWGPLIPGSPMPEHHNLGAGFVPGIERLGIPDINLADSAVGVRMAAMQSRYSTLLPSTLGAASSWNPDAAFLYGSVIGRELRAQGYNMSIGGGVNITREPRNGRNFEYAGEDPILAGTMSGNLMKGVQSQQVMGDIKHYALNDQETGRDIMNVILDKRAMRETDLLAFQIAIGIANPSGVMCAYNKINGDYSCENDYTLNEVLKKDFAFKGWVLSDWMGTHSTKKAALAGLDQEMPGDTYFGAALKKAVQDGSVPQARVNDMVHRILRSMFAAGVIDNPPMPRRVVDPFRGRDDAQSIEEQSIVLLKNADNILPVNPSIQSIAIIGSHADVGILSGGGSAQVDAPGGNAIHPEPGVSPWDQPIWFPSSPMKNIQAKAPGARVTFNDGKDVAAAASLAKASQIAIVFVNQPMSEGHDAATLSLPDNQDALVSAVVSANPKTIVVLETGGPVTMPWSNAVAGIAEIWYPGIGGGQALANILFGDVNPSGKLPVTFARSDADLPHPLVPGMDLWVKAEEEAKKSKTPWQVKMPPFDIHYTEGMKVGYKWFEAEHKQPLFPFGFGLSYTSYAYADLKVDAEQKTVSFSVKNSGSRAGTEIAQIYAELPSAADEPFKRLIGWQRVTLAGGETKQVTLNVDPLYLSIFNVQKNSFELLAGDYKIYLGGSSSDTPLSAPMPIK
jgi:beta-glucosidase